MGRIELTPIRGDLRIGGPTILVEIAHPIIENEAAKSVRRALPAPFRITALIDTGASCTVINPQIVRTCDLRQTGFVNISSAGHVTNYPEYAASISFPSAN